MSIVLLFFLRFLCEKYELHNAFGSTWDADRGKGVVPLFSSLPQLAQILH